MSSRTDQYFDIKKKKQYIGNWCLFKRCYESEYTKIYVIDIVDNLIKYKYSNNDREIIEDKRVFPTMLNSIRVYFNYIIKKGSGFIFKNVELLKELFHKLDFIFDHLSKDFENIVIFMTFVYYALHFY